MYLHQFGIQFEGHNRPIKTRDVTPAGLHGMLYDVLERSDAEGATWLHEYKPPNWSHTYAPPKPYTLAETHYDQRRQQLAGMLLSTLTQQTHEFVFSAFRHAYENQIVLRLGKQECLIENLFFFDGTNFEELEDMPPAKRVGLKVITPAAFRQGHGELMLPVPRNVFQRPYFVWNAFAPEWCQLPEDWIDWCEQTVFVNRHNIRTVRKNINYNRPFSGFVGDVWFGVRRDKSAEKQRTAKYSSILNALAHFANYSGIGMKTTMGMGAVQVIEK